MNLVITQALATGLPVITTIHSGLPDQVKDGSNGFLVEERDFNKLAEKIIMFIDNKEKWLAMSQAARLHVEENYSSEILIKKQIDWYDSVIAKNSD